MTCCPRFGVLSPSFLIPIALFCAPLLPCALAQGTAPAGRSGAAQTQSPPELMIFLGDVSNSRKQQPPDTTQAMILQFLEVASLSDQPVQVAVVLFGGDQNKVHVIGDDQGQPTAALDTLRKRVLDQWVPLGGATPMDAALQRVQEMVQQHPRAGRITIVSSGDGRPDSGQLRPQDFPEVQIELERQLKQIRNQKFPPAIEQQAVAVRRRLLLDISTAEGRKLYDQQQLPAEFARCLSLAGDFKARRNLRLISLDFAGGIPELRQIHDAAGGRETDYLILEPHQIIERLHDLGLTTLRKVVVPQPRTLPAAAQTFDLTLQESVAEIAAGSLFSLRFDPPIEDFDRHVQLSARVDGQEFRFQQQAPGDPRALLAVDTSGRVVLATLNVPQRPQSGQVSFHYQSPRHSWSVPTITVFRHFRLRDDLQLQVRPESLPPEDNTCYSFPPGVPFPLVAELAQTGDGTAATLKSFEAVFRQTRGGQPGGGQPLRVSFLPDPHAVGRFRSDNPVSFPPGHWDLAAHLVLPSGTPVILERPEYFQVQQADEHLTVQPDEQTTATPGGLDFGEKGDVQSTGTLWLTLRSANLEYPVPVEVAVVELTDQAGGVIPEAWMQPRGPAIALFPGRAQRVALDLQLPPHFPAELTDGLITGRVLVRRTDLDLPLELRPFSAGARETPIDEVRFVLRRPTWQVQFAGSSARLRESEMPELSLNLDVGLPWQDDLELTLSHSSATERTATMTVTGPFHDEQGREISGLSLLPLEEGSTTLTVSPQQTATVRYRLSVPEGVEFQQATGYLQISAPGMDPVLVPVSIGLRDPLLGSAMRRGLLLLAGLLAVLLVRSVWQRGRLARDQTEAERVLTVEQADPRLGTLAPLGRGRVVLESGPPLSVRRQSETRWRPVSGRLRIAPTDLSVSNPLLISHAGDEDDRFTVALTDLLSDADGQPELHGYVLSSGAFGVAAEQLTRQLRRRLLLLAGLGALIVWFFHPAVLRWLQWGLDHLTWL